MYIKLYLLGYKLNSCIFFFTYGGIYPPSYLCYRVLTPKYNFYKDWYKLCVVFCNTSFIYGFIYTQNEVIFKSPRHILDRCYDVHARYIPYSWYLHITWQVPSLSSVKYWFCHQDSVPCPVTRTNKIWQLEL